MRTRHAFAGEIKIRLIWKISVINMRARMRAKYELAIKLMRARATRARAKYELAFELTCDSGVELVDSC